MAATVTWNVAGSGTWDTVSNNWTGGAPDPNKYVDGDAAIFNNAAGGTITLSAVLAPVSTTVSAASGTYTFVGPGSISTGTLSKSGLGNLVISSANSYGGVTSLTGGNTTITMDTALGASGAGSQTTITGSNGSTGTILTLGTAAALTINETINFNSNAGGRATLTHNSALNHTLAGPIDVSSTGTLVQWSSNGAGSITVTGDITGTMSGGSLLFLRGGSTSATNRILGSLNLTGANLAKTDTGLWVVGAAGETYSWNNTQVAVGTLRTGVSAVLPSTGAVTIGQNDNLSAVLDLAGTNQTTTGVTYNYGTTAVSSTGAITTGAGTLTLNGNLTYNTVNTYTGAGGSLTGLLNLGGGTRTFTINDSTGAATEFTLGATTSNGSLTKAGAGTMVMTGNYTGGTITVNGGILALGAGTGDGINPSTNDITVNAGATLRFDANNRIQNSAVLTLNGTGTLNRNGFGDAIGALSGNGSVIGNGGLTIDTRQGVVSTFTGSITGTGAFDVRGENVNGTAAKQVLTGTLNTGGQPLNIRRGNTANDTVILELGGAGTSTVGTVNVGLSGSGSATLDITGTHTLNAGSFSIGEQSSQPGTVNQSGGTVNASGVIRNGHWPSETSNYNLINGALNLTGNPAAQVNQGAVAEQNGVFYLGIDGTGNFTVTGGTASMTALVLDGRGATAGIDTFTLNGGKVSLGNAANATTLANSGIFAGNSNNAANIASSKINFGGGTLGANANWSSALPMELTGIGGNANVDTDGMSIALSGALSGVGGLNKLDTGTLTLSNVNTYAGTTTVSGGTLALVNAATMNNIASSPVIDVDSGASLDVTGLQGGTLDLANTQTLMGGGTIIGNLIIDNGARHSPGNSPGTSFVMGNETWGPAGGYIWEFDQADNSQVNQDALMGVDPGFDFIDISGTLDITANSGNPFIIDVQSLVHPSHAAGANNLNDLLTFSWTIATADGGITGFDPMSFSIARGTGWDPFYGNTGGFFVTQVGNSIVLNFQGIPEPTTGLLGLLGAAALLRRGRRQIA